MKKTITIVILLITIIANAQENHFGLIGGYNLVTQVTTTGATESGGTDKASGVIVGGFAEFGFHGQFSLMPQVLYTSIKNKENSNSVSYLLIPVLAKYKLTDKFAVMAGPQLNYSLNEESANVKKTNFALDFGLTYAITENIFVQSNYALGLSNMVDLPGYESKMHHLHFSVGYKFN